MGIFAALAPLAMGAAKAGLGAAIGGGLQSMFGGGGSKTTTFDPYSLYSPEQLKSVRALESLASTGSGGGLTLGEGYEGDLGHYQQNQGELQALENLQGLFGGQDMTGARDVYSRMANNQFNPDDPSSGYASFSRALAKYGAESQDVINREAARTGGAFGSGRGRDTASLQADMANQRGSFLANLYNQGENRAMQGAQGLQSMISTQQNLLNNIATQSSMERILKDKEMKDRYAEFGRARNEEMKRIGLMQDIMGQPFGTRSMTSAGESGGFSSMIGQAFTPMIQGGLNQAVGGMGSMLSGMFGKKA